MLRVLVKTGQSEGRCVDCSLGCCAFASAGPTVWNSLPEYWNNPAAGYNQFRCDLQMFLLAQLWRVAVRAFEVFDNIYSRYTSPHLLLANLELTVFAGKIWISVSRWPPARIFQHMVCVWVGGDRFSRRFAVPVESKRSKVPRRPDAVTILPKGAALLAFLFDVDN